MFQNPSEKTGVFWLAGLALLILITGSIAGFSMTPAMREQIRENWLNRRLQNWEGGSGQPLSQLQAGGLTRNYYLYVPPGYSPKRKTPLVIMLHGGGGNAHNAEAVAQMIPAAREKGVLVVYPNGTGPLKDRLLTWNADNCCGYALDHQVDDVGYIRALISRLEQEYNIDPKRIYATGLSNGGMMTYKLGCELSDKLAAIAPVAGALNDPQCKPKAPLSVIAFHGTSDLHVLYQGGHPIQKADLRHDRIDRSVAYSVGFWVNHNHCAPAPKKTQTGAITQEVYSGCDGNANVTLYSVQRGGHAWPGGKSYLGGVEPTQEISATQLMLDFFLKHPKP